jgi:glycosyltransferase involved in cell wall biosynthesis
MNTMPEAGLQRAGNGCLPAERADSVPGYEVVCVCRGCGFPFGAGDPPRIISVGKALQSAGVKFRVLHCGPSPLAANQDTAGVYEGIPFEYTTYSTKRPSNRVLRILLYAWSLSILILRILALFPGRRRTCVYIYIQNGPIGVIVAAISRLLGIPVVQEVNEWWPGTPDGSPFLDWLYGGPMFSLANGTLVISSLIEERVRAIAEKSKRQLIVQRTPILVDMNEFHPGQPARSSSCDDLPQFVWCGGVAAYPKDIDFLIRALGRVTRRGLQCQLTIAGAVREDAGRRVLEYARVNGVAGAVVLTGFIDDARLDALYRSAAGLLLPLFDDDRSRTRMPTKLGGYLASGTPVITCAVGDLTNLLRHGQNAYVGAPGDEQAFAENMCAVLRDRAAAREIGAAGRRVCAAEIHYEVHAVRLADFFSACIRSGQWKRAAL